MSYLVGRFVTVIYIRGQTSSCHMRFTHIRIVSCVFVAPELHTSSLKVPKSKILHQKEKKGLYQSFKVQRIQKKKRHAHWYTLRVSYPHFINGFRSPAGPLCRLSKLQCSFNWHVLPFSFYYSHQRRTLVVLLH